MSVQSALQFFSSRVATTASLGQQFIASVNGKTEAEAAQIASDLGREHGFTFTAAEAAEARRLGLAVLAQAKAGGAPVELSSDELDQVAGGGYTPTSTLTSGLTTAAGTAVAGGPGPGAAVGIAVNSLNISHQNGESPVSGDDVVTHVANQVADNVVTNFTTSNSIFLQW